jgi:hypothetical protein
MKEGLNMTDRHTYYRRIRPLSIPWGLNESLIKVCHDIRVLQNQ